MIPPDVRAYSQALLTTMPSQLLVPYLHPVFYSLHNMPKEVCFPALVVCHKPFYGTNRAHHHQCGTISEQGVVLPHPLPLTSERLERHGLFLIEDGQNIFLWVGRDAVNQLVLDVFDLPSYADLRSGKVSLGDRPFLETAGKLTQITPAPQGTLPILDNAFSQRVNAIIGKVREARRGPYYPHLYIVKEDGDPALRQWALSLLIEDRMETLPSYQQFINKLKDSVSLVPVCFGCYGTWC
jgi:protein transport protein SEC24